MIISSCAVSHQPKPGFMSIAAGFASEVEYPLLLACVLNYIQDETFGELNQQVNEVKRMLNSFIKKPTAQIALF